MSEQTLSRRERVRRQTLGEIKQHALEQVAEGGAQALSLNAIAKAMGMSGPAIYRYYGSREELLAAIVTDGYRELATVVLDAAATAARRAPARRLKDIAAAYRAWALANPYLYELLFSVRPPDYADPPEAIMAIQPAMDVLLAAYGEIAAETGRQTDLDALGVFTWTRIHGIVTLELAGVLGDMNLDGALLVRQEIESLVATA